MKHSKRLPVYVDPPNPGDLILGPIFYPWNVNGSGTCMSQIDVRIGVIVSTIKLALTHPCRAPLQTYDGGQYILGETWAVVMFGTLLCLAPLSYLTTVKHELFKSCETVFI